MIVFPESFSKQVTSREMCRAPRNPKALECIGFLPYTHLGHERRGAYGTIFPGGAVVAQLAVNELVVGSNPTRGAQKRNLT